MAETDPLAALRAACAEPLDHPDSARLRQASEAIVDFALDEFARLGELDPAATSTRAQMEKLLRQPPPERGSDLMDALAAYRHKIAPYNMRPQHPRFLAFVPSAPTFVSVLGEWLCAVSNVFAGVWKESAAASQIELVVLDWFKELMGYPAAAAGLLTSGGSEANLTALLVARAQLSYDARQRAVLYVSEQRHRSIDRAAHVIGLRSAQVRILSAGPDYRLVPSDLAAAITQDRRAGKDPWLLVANAGATNTGSVDPLAELAEVCRRERLWLHADAAYGWPAVLTEQGRAELRGLDRADSVTLDPHKWLAQTYDVGCLLVRRGTLLEEAFAMRPEYMQDVAAGPDEVNFADRGLALTRRFRALKIWLSLEVLGVAWFRRLVEHGYHLAEFAQAALERSGCFEILSPRQLSTLCFRYVPPSWKAPEGDSLDVLNRMVCEELQKSGQAFLATTRLRGCTALRLCFVNWRTTAADVERIVELLQEIGARLANTRPLAG
jgi:aromatic-L-amino-acid/L-tryptophan decarboxylase